VHTIQKQFCPVRAFAGRITENCHENEDRRKWKNEGNPEDKRKHPVKLNEDSDETEKAKNDRDTFQIAVRGLRDFHEAPGLCKNAGVAGKAG
jgi:hypothetical protein